MHVKKQYEHAKNRTEYAKMPGIYAKKQAMCGQKQVDMYAMKQYYANMLLSPNMLRSIVVRNVLCMLRSITRCFEERVICLPKKRTIQYIHAKTREVHHQYTPRHVKYIINTRQDT